VDGIGLEGNRRGRNNEATTLTSYRPEGKAVAYESRGNEIQEESWKLGRSSMSQYSPTKWLPQVWMHHCRTGVMPTRWNKGIIYTSSFGSLIEQIYLNS